MYAVEYPPKKRGRKAAASTEMNEFVSEATDMEEKPKCGRLRIPAAKTLELGAEAETEAVKKTGKRAWKQTKAKTGGRRKRGKLSSEEKQKQAEEMPMAFPKGTFLLRYSDLQDLECDQIWCVDNQYMLLKYIPSSHIDEKRRLFLKTRPERYIGWRCQEPWHFYKLQLLEYDRFRNRVVVLYPNAEELATAWEEAKRQRELHEETKAEASSTTGDLSSYANFTAGSAVNQPILNKEQQQQVFDNYKLFFEQGSSLEMDQYDGVEAYEEIDDAVAAELLGDDFVILNDNDQ